MVHVFRVMLVAMLGMSLAAGLAAAQTQESRPPSLAPTAALPSPSPSSPWTAEDRARLEAGLRALVEDPRWKGSHVGVAILPLDPAAGPGLTWQADKLFVPASTLKLFTTAAALDMLGPEKTLVTRLLHSGAVQGGVLRGDLLVVGGGDPGFAQRFCNGWRACLPDLAKAVADKGIREIQGAILADVSRFPGPALGPGWEWDDELTYYATPVTALPLNENMAEVRLEPQGAGKPPLVQSFPPGVFRVAEGSFRPGPGKLSITRKRGEDVLEIGGTIPATGKAEGLSLPLADPPAAFLTVLAQCLREAGVTVTGGTRVLPGAAGSAGQGNQTGMGGWTLLAERPSMPMAALARVANKESHNLFAETILKTIGAEKGGGSFQHGANTVERWAAGLGVPTGSLVMVDGSGLSRKNMVSPRAMAQMLRAMAGRPAFAAYHETLPIAGREGSMGKRFNGTRGEGVLRAKVGYVQNNSSIAGYVQDVLGRWYSFAVLVNNHGGPPRESRELQDAAVELVLNLGAAPASPTAPPSKKGKG